MNRRLSLAALAVCLALVGAITFDLFAPSVVPAATVGGGHVDASTLAGLLPLAALGGFAVAELHRKQAKLITDMEALARSDLTDEAQTWFDELEAGMEVLDGTIRRAGWQT